MPWKKDHPSWPLNPPGAIYQELPEPLAPLPVPSRPRPSRPSRAESHWAMVVPQFGIAFSWGPHNSNFTIWFMADISKLTRVYKPTFTSLGGTTLWVIKHNHRDLYGISWDLWEDTPHSGSIYFAGSICTANTGNGEFRIKPNLPCPRLYGKISCGIMGN